MEPCDIQNGCLYVAPGSHRLGRVFPHDYPPNEPMNKFYHGIQVRLSRPSSIFICIVLHPALENRESIHRRQLGSILRLKPEDLVSGRRGRRTDHRKNLYSKNHEATFSILESPSHLQSSLFVRRILFFFLQRLLLPERIIYYISDMIVRCSCCIELIKYSFLLILGCFLSTLHFRSKGESIFLIFFSLSLSLCNSII